MKIYILVINLLLQIFAGFDTASAEWTVLVSDNGTVEIVDLETTPEDSKHTLEELKEAVLFYLYTSSSSEDAEQLYLEDDDTLESSKFNASNPTRIVIHGWQSSSTAKVATLIRDAYLGAGEYNMILVDWSDYADLGYIYARTKIVAVGEYVGLMIDYLAFHGMDTKDLIVIGHSLGAHVAGNACRSSNNNVSILIGLDPAGPLFYTELCDARMNKTDADYTQVIYTSAGWLGHKWDLGVANLWVNGGSKQTGCNWDIFRICAHRRSYFYFAESIANSTFSAYSCNSYSNFTAGNCDTNPSTVLGGCDIDTSANGVYYLDTNPSSLFALS